MIELGENISTHTPAWGATYSDALRKLAYCISTHTPARGATLSLVWHLIYSLNFNSHAREGRDICLTSTQSKCYPFQLTRPRGARQTVYIIRRSRLLFQLTRPRGARHRVFDRITIIAEFQLTRPRGARHSDLAAVWEFYEFQLTRPRGARRCVSRDGSSVGDFNSHAREGRDKSYGTVAIEL